MNDATAMAGVLDSDRVLDQAAHGLADRYPGVHGHESVCQPIEDSDDWHDPKDIS